MKVFPILKPQTLRSTVTEGLRVEQTQRWIQGFFRHSEGLSKMDMSQTLHRWHILNTLGLLKRDHCRYSIHEVSGWWKRDSLWADAVGATVASLSAGLLTASKTAGSWLGGQILHSLTNATLRFITWKWTPLFVKESSLPRDHT